MPKEIIVTPEAGQHVVINPKGSLKIVKASVSSTKLTARVVTEGTYVEAPPPPPPPVEPPPPTASRPIYGMGQQVTGGAGKPIFLVTTLASSGPGSLAYLLGGAQSDRRIQFAVEGTINLDPGIDARGRNVSVEGASAPGKGITLTGDQIQIAYGARNYIVTDLRHRGFGPTGTNDGDLISPVNDCQGVILARLSLSGANDESIGIWRNVYDVTIQDCIIGAHAPASADHNFAVLFGAWSKRISFHHNLIHGSNYRNPAVGWDADAGDVPPSVDADEIVGDVVNNLIWDYVQFGTSVYHGGKANVIKNYYQGRTNGVVEVVNRGKAFLSGNVSREGYAFPVSNATRFPVPAYAAIPEEATALDAAKSVLAKAGCRVGGLDAYDKAIVDSILATI